MCCDILFILLYISVTARFMFFYKPGVTNLHFEDNDQTSRTGWRNRSDRFSHGCHFWVRTYALLFSGKAYVPENILLDQTYLKMMISNTSPI